MPIYEFQAEDGTRIERYFSARSDQAGGAPIRERGKVYLRVVSTPQVQQDVKPYVSPSLPKGIPGVKYNAKGKAIIESKRQERQVAREFL